MLDKNLKRELPFDLYGRYKLIQDIIIKNSDNNPEKILDVGGRGNLLKKFFDNESKYSIYYLDPLVNTEDSNFIEGDGCNMPLEDESFDWVVSADVFEHITPEKRVQFLSEKLRVAKKGIILINPFHSQKTQLAEINANNIYKSLFGQDHQWLQEHIKLGLPEESMVTNFIQDKNLEFYKINNNNLVTWQFLVGLQSLVNYLKLNQPEIEALFHNFNEFYNNFVFPKDFDENSYRKIYVIAKNTNTKLKKLDINPEPLPEILLYRVYNEYYKLINNSINTLSSKLTDKINSNQQLQEQVNILNLDLNNLRQSSNDKIQKIINNKTQEIKNLQQEYQKQLNLVENNKNIILELNSTIDILQNESKSNKSIITEQNNLINNFENKILQDESKIVEISKSLENLQEKNLQSESRISDLNDLVNSTQKQLNDKSKQLDFFISENNKNETKLINLNFKLENLEIQINKSNEDLIEKQNIIKKQEIDIKERQEYNFILKQKIFEFERDLNGRNNLLREYHELIVSMKNSKFWLIRKWYLKFKFAIFSPHKFIKKYYVKLSKKK